MVFVAGFAWLVAPAGASALPQKVCPRIEMDLEDAGNGETYWNSSTVWAEADAAGMRVRVRTFRVTSTGGCDWNTVVADKLGFLDQTGCSPAIETGSSTRACYAVELRSYGDPDLSVGTTGTCSTSDPGCNVFVWGPLGLEASTMYVAGPIYADGTAHYDHVGAPESVQNYVTLAYAYRKWGRPIGAQPGQGDVFTDDKAKVNLYLTGDEHTCGCTGSSTVARTCLVPQLSGPISHHANICIPDIASFRGPDKKFVVTHQWGHVALYLPGALAGTPLGLARDCSYPSVGGSDQTHDLESREWSGCALAEGFAHFVAADTFNDHGTDADGVFTYWEPCGDQAGGVGDRRVKLESGGFDPKCSEKYLDTKLAGGTSTAGQGSELDWLRFFWDYHTDRPVAAGGAGVVPTHAQLLRTVQQQSPGDSRLAYSAFRDAVRTTHGCSQLADRAVPLARSNGVNACLNGPCENAPGCDQTCAVTSDCGANRVCFAEGDGSKACGCTPRFSGPTCSTCAPGYTGQGCTTCAAGFHPEHRVFGQFVERDLSSEAAATFTGPSADEMLCVPNTPFACTGAGATTCGGHGTCVLLEGTPRCQCQPGYVGPECGQCIPGFERDAAGNCAPSTSCRRSFCFDKGNCALDANRKLQCICDPGFTGADCGGPRIVVEGPSSSIVPGQAVTLRASGGTAPYVWTLEAGPGTVTAGTSGTATYVATSTPAVLDVAVVRVRDTSGFLADFGVTLASPDALPVSGIGRPQYAAFDRNVLTYMKARGIRAGSLALAVGGQVVHSRGYGFMDAGTDSTPFIHSISEGGVGRVQPTTRFRLGSISKVIAGATVHDQVNTLQAGGQLPVGLDTPALPVIAAVIPDVGTPTYRESLAVLSKTPTYPAYQCSGAFPDPQFPEIDRDWTKITINHLLTHTAGFDRCVSPKVWTERLLPNGQQNDSFHAEDPMSANMLMAHRLETLRPGIDLSGPFQARDIIRYMTGMCLAYRPGQRPAELTPTCWYSNFGFVLLGRVIEGLAAQHGPHVTPPADQLEGFGAFLTIAKSFMAKYGPIEGAGSELTEIAAGDQPYYRDGELWQLGSVAGFNESIKWNLRRLNGAMYNALTGFWNVPFAFAAYGGFNLAAGDAAGALVANAPTLARFLGKHSVHYGRSRPAGSGTFFGSMPGTFAMVANFEEGDSVVDLLSPTGMWGGQAHATVGEQSVRGSSARCRHPTFDAVVLFNQNRDPKTPLDTTKPEEYFRLSDFVLEPACTSMTAVTPDLTLPESEFGQTTGGSRQGGCLIRCNASFGVVN